MDGLFDIFQFVALLAFLALFVGRIVTMRLREGINPITLAAGKTGLRMLAEALLPIGLVAWALAIVLASFDVGLPWGLDESLVNDPAVQTAGAALIVGGIAVFALALVAFGASWRVGIDEEHPGGLVTDGVFRFSRNPIFLFLDAYFVGAFLINGTVFFLAGAVLAVTVTHYQILQEERFLESRYGKDYLEYKRRTPRYVSLLFPSSGVHTEEGGAR